MEQVKSMRGRRPFSEDEVRRVAAGFSGRYGVRNRAFFLLGVRTGFRVSELLSFRIGDVAGERVTVRRSDMKGNREGRTVPLHAEARTALRLWIEELTAVAGPQPATAFIFRPFGRPDRPITRVMAGKCLAAACAVAGAVGQIGTHSMRKTFAATMQKALGGDVLKIQQALGHRQLQSTIAYLSFARDEIDRAIMGDGQMSFWSAIQNPPA